MPTETLLRNARIATMTKASPPYGLLSYGAIAIKHGEIAWVGDDAELPAEFGSWPGEDLDGRLMTPGLIDCHTHLIYGGDRAAEFEARLGGATYEEISRAGGGIASTVKATRAADKDSLLQDALVRLNTLISEGVTTVEVKSGYGLDVETELNMLRVARELGSKSPVRVMTSFLGAHAVPSEYGTNSDNYIDHVVIPTLEVAAKENLVDAVDGFCETIAFSPRQMTRVFDRAKELGLPVKLHAEQLSNLGGAELAASYGALSADHLEYLDEAGVDAMANSGTVAVLLPGAFYTLGETQLPPLTALRDAGLPIAIATDCNPGSSPLTSILLAMNMACTLFRLTPEEALAGVTREAARALGLLAICGTIEAGKRADLAIWNVRKPAELSYRMGFNPLHRRIFGSGA